MVRYVRRSSTWCIANITIKTGTGIALYGNVYQAAYSISVDGEGQHMGVPKGDLLAEVQGLEATQHLIALVAHPSPNSTNVPSSYVAFDQAALNVSTEFAGYALICFYLSLILMYFLLVRLCRPSSLTPQAVFGFSSATGRTFQTQF